MASRTRRPSRPPTLTAEIVQDEEQLSDAIDDFIKTSPVMQAHARRVRKRQDALRRAVDDDHWAVVIALDDAHVDRVAELTVLLARWAFGAGGLNGDRGGRPR
jgi:hypothetical protein